MESLFDKLERLKDPGRTFDWIYVSSDETSDSAAILSGDLIIRTIDGKTNDAEKYHCRLVHSRVIRVILPTQDTPID